jgi:hypothetical protein
MSATTGTAAASTLAWACLGGVRGVTEKRHAHARGDANSRVVAQLVNHGGTRRRSTENTE